MKELKEGKNKKFLKYSFYQKALKINKKYYFLLDFFYGLKGTFLYKKKKIKEFKNFIYAKSFNSFILSKNFNKNKFDYFYSNLNNLNHFHKFNKKKENIFLPAVIKGTFMYLFNLKNLWLLQHYLSLKNLYMQFLNLKLFSNLNYLNIYYNFIKYNYVIKNYIFLKNYFIYKWNIKLLNKKFILLNNIYMLKYMLLYILKFNKVNLCVYNKYNNFKHLKTLFINKNFRKLNRFLNNFNVYKNKELLKFFLIQYKKKVNFDKFDFYNKISFFSKNKKKKLVYKEKEFVLKNKAILIKTIFYFYFFENFYIKQHLNYKNKSNILFKYYFYFYNFIIKIFIKLFNNFKLIILNKDFKINLLKNIIWFKIFIVFLYYKKIIINKMSSKLIRNFKLNISTAKYNISNIKFNHFIKSSSEIKKRIVNEKLDLFKKDLELRLDIIKKIKHYKKINDYYYLLKFKNLEKIYNTLNNKINKVKEKKNNNLLKLNKLYKFIKHNKLKKKNILKELDINLNLQAKIIK